MAYSLIWLPEVLRAAGLKVAECAGWADRGHGDMAKLNGVSAVKGVICHHTGVKSDKNMPTLNALINGRTAPPLAGPLAQLGLGRDGTYYVVAAGRCYHAGEGGWRNVTGNSHFIGIEGENAGVKEDLWPEVQMDAYRRGVAAILKKIGASADMCCGHREYAPGRKDDPLFDMDTFRAAVASILQGTAVTRPLIPAQTADGKPTLLRGAKGDAVRELQAALKITPADGVFGPSTETAVRAFQRQHEGVVPDGIVGPKTWDILPPPA